MPTTSPTSSTPATITAIQNVRRCSAHTVGYAAAAATAPTAAADHPASVAAAALAVMAPRTSLCPRAPAAGSGSWGRGGRGSGARLLWRLVVAAEHRLQARLRVLRAGVGAARGLRAGAVGLVGLSRCGAVSRCTWLGAQASPRRGEAGCAPVPPQCCWPSSSELLMYMKSRHSYPLLLLALHLRQQYQAIPVLCQWAVAPWGVKSDGVETDDVENDDVESDCLFVCD